MRRFHEDKKHMLKRNKVSKMFKGFTESLGRLRKRKPLGCPHGKKCKICHYDKKREPTRQEMLSQIELDENT